MMHGQQIGNDVGTTLRTKVDVGVAEVESLAVDGAHGHTKVVVVREFDRRSDDGLFPFVQFFASFENQSDLVYKLVPFGDDQIVRENAVQQIVFF
ncbi:hypothetical protein MHBO_000738 [Bonamia ostreae]|uniref:Uncharacterized protein n=1 Tax=Bonamia ostreae TaxID=126728 RepID=A0ABV2AGN0_9EUKA